MSKITVIGILWIYVNKIIQNLLVVYCLHAK
jgi:hypothetical protein